MNTKILYPFFLLLLLSCWSCNRDNIPNREDRLTREGGWKFVSYTTNLGEKANAISNAVDLADLGGLSREIFEAFLVDIAAEADTFRTCQLDERYFFVADGRLTVNNGPTSCDPANPRADAVIPSLSNWSLEGEVLSVSTDGNTKNYKVNILSEETLQLEITEPYHNEDLEVSSTVEVTETLEFASN